MPDKPTIEERLAQLEAAPSGASDSALIQARAEVAALEGRVRELEGINGGLRADLETARAMIEQQAAGMSVQARKLADAQRLRREAELHAAAVILEADPGFDPTKKVGADQVRTADVQVSPATAKVLNPETRLVVHVHTDTCPCDQSAGHRVSATVQPLAARRATPSA